MSIEVELEAMRRRSDDAAQRWPAVAARYRDLVDLVRRDLVSLAGPEASAVQLIVLPEDVDEPSPLRSAEPPKRWMLCIAGATWSLRRGFGRDLPRLELLEFMAEAVQGATADEEHMFWPICPGHGLPSFEPKIVNSVVMWWCSKQHSISEVGRATGADGGA
jgi:hypothetical protein